MNRRDLLLVGLLAILVGLDVVTTPDGAPTRAVGPLLVGFDSTQATRIELRRDGEESLVLERGSEEGDWVLPGTFGYRARTQLAEDLLSRLASLSTLDLVTEEASRHGDYGVDQGVLVRVEDGEGRELASLLQGGVSPDGRATWGRRPSEDATYRLPLFAPLRLDPLWWLDARLLSFEPGLIRRIELEIGERARVLERDLARVGVWRTPEGVPAVGADVEALLEALRGTFLTEVLSAEELDPAASSAAVSLVFEGREPLTLSVEPGPEGARATLAGSGFTVALDRGTWARLEARLGDLLP